MNYNLDIHISGVIDQLNILISCKLSNLNPSGISIPEPIITEPTQIPAPEPSPVIETQPTQQSISSGIIPNPTNATKIIYVSDTDGNDNFDGLTKQTPKKTLGEATSLLTNGDVRLLLKRGDRFINQSLGKMTKSGESKDAPLVIGSYGTGPRPIIMPDAGQDGLVVQANKVISNFVLTDIDLYSYTRDPGNSKYKGPNPDGECVRWLSGADNIIFNSCSFRYFVIGTNLQDFSSNGFKNGFLFRNCDFLSAYNTNAHANGIYVESKDAPVDWIRFEGCIFDHNGWDKNAGANKTIFNHNAYIQSSANLSHNNVSFDRCLFSRASSHGVQLRPGGSIRNCLFIENAISILLGGGDEPIVGGVNGLIDSNIILDGTDIETSPRGIGIDLTNIKSAMIKNNIVANVENVGVNNFAYSENANTTFINNIEYNWGTTPDGSKYIAPNRTIEDYDKLAGGPGTRESFYENLRDRKYSIDSIRDFFRQGFSEKS